MTTQIDNHDPAETNGQLTKDDEYRRKISSEVSEAYRELGRAQMRFERCKSEAKSAKGDVESAQQDVNDLVAQLRDLEVGQYQPDLFGKADGETSAATPPAVDEGASKPIAELATFGITEKQCELLRDSKLEIKTVGDLEKAIRDTEWWHRDCKGLGEQKISKVIDALVEFRLTYPVPVKDEPAFTKPDGTTIKGADALIADVKNEFRKAGVLAE